MTEEETKSKEHLDMIENLIVNTLDWQPLGSFESRNSKKVAENKIKYGTYGVYLVAQKTCLPDKVIDSNIGYVGKSANIFNRVYDIRGGDHGVRKYINSKGIPPEDVYVKLLFTEKEGHSYLEELIHDENERRFGYRFAWKEASGGNDGAMTRVFNEIDKIENEEDLIKIADYIEERAIMLYRNNWRNR